MAGAIILAAGGSSRLGKPKQFLIHDGETLLRRAVRAAIGGGCWPVVVVAGMEGSRVEQEVADFAVSVVHNSEWQRGIGSSIRAGLKQALVLGSCQAPVEGAHRPHGSHERWRDKTLAPELPAVVIMVCDQPFVTAEVIAALLAKHAAEQMNVASAYASTIGVPALFTRRFFNQLAALPDARGARDLLAQSPEEVVCVPFPNGAIDIDTAADCRAHLNERSWKNERMRE